MKRLFLLALLIGVSVLHTTNAFAVPNAGEATTVVTTSSSNTLTMTTPPSSTTTALDSLYLAMFTPYSSTDTLFVALLDTAWTDSTITGLAGATQYIAFILARDGNGDTDISGKDSVTTYRTQFGDLQGPTKEMYRKVGTDASWPFGGSSVYSMDTTFDLDGANASDYSLLYYQQENNAVDIIATQAGDSTVATVYFYPVNVIPTWNDRTFYRSSTVIDSINITSSGLTRDSVSLAAGQAYQMLIYTLLGNGKDADFELFYTSTTY